MSGLDLLVGSIGGRLHCVVTGKAGLHDLYADPTVPAAAWASLYLGKVAKIDTKLDAAIIDLGNGLQGLLPAKHVHLSGGDASERRSGISALLKAGQTLLVQVKSEGRAASAHEQAKLPRLTTKLYIVGHHLVHCPLASPVTMSRQIERKDVLGMTAKLQAAGGWILQLHAEEEDVGVLEEEARKLLGEWNVIRGAEAGSGGKPRLLKAGPNALHRALFDYGAAGFDHIHAADRKTFEALTEWCGRYDPPLATSKRLRLFRPEKAGQSLFDAHDALSEIEALAEKRVELSDGGSIIIERTQALVVIDVNQGTADNAFSANLSAAKECARQVRLRNLSGAILVDFIGVEDRTQRAQLLDALVKAFAGDPGEAQVHGFTRLGIAEVTRKRRSASYLEKTA